MNAMSRDYSGRDKGISKRTRDWLVLIICALLLLNLLQFLNYQTTMSRSTVLRETLVSRVKEDIKDARGIAPQLSRTGGSSTMKWLGQTRQYLYGVTQVNELTAGLFGSGQTLVPQSAVDAAFSAIDECENQLMGGLTMDTPLKELWRQLDYLEEVAQALE